MNDKIKGQIRPLIENIVIFAEIVLFLAVAVCVISCTSEFDEEPPKYEKTSDYLLPSSETPTEEERQIINATVLEYLELFM